MMMNMKPRSKVEVDSQHTNETQGCVKLIDSWNLLRPALPWSKPYHDWLTADWSLSVCHGVCSNIRGMGVHKPFLEHIYFAKFFDVLAVHQDNIKSLYTIVQKFVACKIFCSAFERRLVQLFDQKYKIYRLPCVHVKLFCMLISRPYVCFNASSVAAMKPCCEMGWWHVHWAYKNCSHFIRSVCL